MAKRPAAVASGEPEAPAVKTSQKSAKFMTVACKIPNGLVLQLCRKTTYLEDTPSGTRERARYDKVGERHVVAGPAYPNGPVPRGFPPKPMIVGGYALTPNIPRDFFEEWMHQNKDAPFVVNKMIYGYATLDEAREVSKDNRKTLSGFEPLAQAEADKDGNMTIKDPRAPRSMAPGVAQVTTADEIGVRGAPDHHPAE